MVYYGKSRFPGAVRPIHAKEGYPVSGQAGSIPESVRINLCMSYFYTGQYEKAVALYEENRQLLGKFRNGKAYGAHIALIDIIAAIIGRRFDQAEAMLAKARKSWPSPPFQKAFLEAERALEQLRLAGGEDRDA